VSARSFAVLGALLCFSTTLSAAKIDPRLATVRKAWIQPLDELADDRPVAVCLAQHLSTTTPMTLVESREDAEVILSLKAHLPSGTARALLGNMGANPSVDLIVQHADGTMLWKERYKLSSANFTAFHQAVTDVPCGLADAIADKLRQAMRKARDRK
jgi:hypothetical protein